MRNKWLTGALSLAAAGSFAFAGAVAEGGESIQDGVLTLDGVVREFAAESELGEGVTAVVMRNGGGIWATASLEASKTYSIAGDGLAATGVVGVAAGETLQMTGDQLAVGAVGHTLVKRGAGTLRAGPVGRACAAPTRFVVEAGKFQCTGGDFWGGHTTANDNCVIDVREGAVYDHGTQHGVVGPIELTGATFTSRNASPWNNQWADAALNGGVTAHACATPSVMSFASWGFLGHNRHVDCAFNVEAGARLIVDGDLRDGFDNDGKGNRLVKRGDGELVMLGTGGWTGGTVLEGGTVVVGNAQALAAGAITVAGDVTLRVPAGVTFVCPPVTGAGTLTKTGEGVASFPTVAEGVTVTEAAPGTVGAVFKDGVLHLPGGTVTVDVPEGETARVESFAEAEAGCGPLTDIVKTGAGTLVLPEGAEARYRGLTVRGGLVEVAAESCFGTGDVVLEEGGGLRVAASFDQARARVVCRGAVRLDIPADVTLGVCADYFVSAGATVTKTGAGLWRLTSAFRVDQSPEVNLTGTRWVVDEGRLKLSAADVFCGAAGKCPLVIEIHEAGTLELLDGAQHTPVGAIVLRGGTLDAGRAQFRGYEGKLESAAKWKGFGFDGVVTALPSARPARIIARQCHLAHGSGRTVFDVREGAVLEVDTMLQAGRAGNNLNYSGLVKRGGGTLRLLKPIGTRGVFAVEDGVVELGPRMHLNDGLTLDVTPRAKVVLGDGAQVATQMNLFPKLCASADVWFDAAALDLADGAAVSSVPNRGTAGGAFTVERAYNSYTPTAPAYVRDGINGLGAVAFDGSQALMTRAYTNRAARVTVFLVSKWTGWANAGGQGKWGGPLSLAATEPAHVNYSDGDDNQCWGSLSFQHGGGTLEGTLSTYGGDGSSPNLGGVAPLNEGYLTVSGRDGETGRFFTEVSWATGAQAGTNTINTLGGCDIDAVCVGGRLRRGIPQILGAGDGANRMYIGQVGEVLVFSRALTEAETAAIRAYLGNKWFGAGEALTPDAERALAPTLNVEVPAGEADLALDAAKPVAVEKTGAGALRLGGAFADAARVSVAEGGLALRKGAMKPQVDVWVDASESAGMAFDEAGRVTNLVNRGACGGAFVRNARRPEAVPFGPAWSADETINGRPTLVFDGDSALALFSYTNTTAPRQLSVYCVAARTGWEEKPGSGNGGGHGKWAGPFALGDTTATLSDEQVPGVVSVQEGSAESGWIDVGNNSSTGVGVPATGEPYLLVFHATTNGTFVAYERASAPAGPTTSSNVNAQDNEPFRIDVVQLAARTAPGGGPQWWGVEREENRCWYGKIGEFIVTTAPLDEQQEYELFAYLRRKWMAKGDGPETPPAWLAGHPASPTFGPQTRLEMADGTFLAHAADAMALGRLETTGAVNWARVWDQAAGADAATLFDVAGDVALGAVALDIWPVPTEARLVGFAGAELTAATWTVTGGPGAGSASVSRRADGYWIGRGGSVIFIR